ncbi:CBS domain-containing protein [bacterium]|nr:CBS domain-containing protein [bacterium]
MSHPVVTIKLAASIEEMARLMAKKRIKKLPIVENDMLVEIITVEETLPDQIIHFNKF